jgi:enoyl-[acyl-carrier protein] reductase III
MIGSAKVGNFGMNEKDASQRRYAGKKVCITGSSRGIGRQLALRFAQDGADIVVNYFRNGDAARETAKELEGLGSRVLLCKANMAQEDKVIAMFDTIRSEFGHLDVFIHNAASGRNRKAMEVDVKGWDWTLDVNARAFLIGVQQAAQLMTDGGAMLAISSFGSERVFPYYTTVGASKAAIESLVRYFAVELADKHINVNAISAGAVVTGALEHFPEIEQTWAEIERKLPYDRMVNADDVANLALFLCSKEAEMLRGQTVRLDAGLTLLLP